MFARSYRRNKIVSLKKRQSNANIVASSRIRSKSSEGMRKNFGNYFLTFFKII